MAGTAGGATAVGTEADGAGAGTGATSLGLGVACGAGADGVVGAGFGFMATGGGVLSPRYGLSHSVTSSGSMVAT